MEFTLTTAEIREILKGCQQSLQLAQTMQGCRKVEFSEDFSTSDEVILDETANVLFEVIGAIDDSNEVVLSDAVNVLFEVIEAINKYETETRPQLQETGNVWNQYSI
ncbi:hypothetical protein WKK05_09125 [Nostoc sp. UHCC 0302]|uniref:hypothetical protein n=1 Tax=Nostoc sp. UHCC 0302 TaxID=3134896 RepID=UPI00311CD609